MGWTQTDAWKKAHYYANNEPGVKLCQMLLPYQMTPEKWHTKIVGHRTKK
jgi:hypothetical protein